MGANRVENAIEKWREKEGRVSNIFSFSLSTNTMLKRDKLLYYDKIANKYAGTKNREERFSLRMLREERRNLERQLYPNRLFRLLRRLIIAGIWIRIGVSREERQTQEQIRSLQNQVRNAGFEIDAKRLGLKVEEGGQKFKIPLEVEVNDFERQLHQLQFRKNDMGNYQFEGFHAVLSDIRKPTETKRRFFSVKDKWEVNNREAYELLSGRTIKKGDKTLMLDFNDKTASGDFYLREVPGRKANLPVTVNKAEQVVKEKKSIKQVAIRRNGIKIR